MQRPSRGFWSDVQEIKSAIADVAYDINGATMSCGLRKLGHYFPKP